MQSHVLSFSHWISGGSCVCDVLGLCLCVVLVASGCLKSLTLYCTVLNANTVIFFSVESNLYPTAASVKALKKINNTYTRVAKGEGCTQTHVQRPTLATKV